MNTPRLRRLLAAIAVVVAAAVGAAASQHSTPSTGSSTSSDRFWSALWADGTFQTYEDAGLAAAASDVVVVGRFTLVEPGRSVVAVPDFGPDGTLVFATAQVAVEEVLAGAYTPAPDGTLTLELFLPRPSEINELRANTPPERMLLFLRKSPSGGPAVYALLNPESVVRDIADARTLQSATGRLDPQRGPRYDSARIDSSTDSNGTSSSAASQGSSNRAIQAG